MTRCAVVEPCLSLEVVVLAERSTTEANEYRLRSRLSACTKEA